MFAGVLTGSLVLVFSGVSLIEAEPVKRFFLPAVGSNGYARILLIYLWCLGGLIGLWQKTGGARHFAESLGRRFVRSPRDSLVFAWALGVLFHQGGTVSTVLAGSTVKPVADKHRISHEELSYVIDSTASPVATLLPFNAWPAYVATLVVGTVPLIKTEAEAVGFFAMFAVAMTLALALGLPAVGPGLRRAQLRARESGALDAPGAEPMLPNAMSDAESADAFDPIAGYRPSLIDFALPIGVLLSVAVLPIVFFDESFVEQAFLLCVLSGMTVAGIRGMPLRDILDGFVRGCQSMTIGAIVLGLAVTLAAGTSWGTYAVVFPLALPLAYAIEPSAGYLHICFGAVLGGAVFGDQCSPISDTTILSSMFTGCDMMDHVRTQIPPALVAALAGILISTFLAAA